MMRRCTRLTVATALFLSLVPAALGGTALAPVTVVVAPRPSVLADVHINFRPHPLPRGGFYYAVIVLSRYEGESQETPPPCAISSDMAKTEYGFPHGRRSMRLTLLPAASSSGRWCTGRYTGAVYAVPHAPPCRNGYYCYGTSAQSSCWILEEGKRVCGVVAKPGRPPYSYPGGLPKPLDRSARIVARFAISF